VKGRSVEAVYDRQSRVAAKDRSHGRKAVVDIDERMSRVAAEESFAAMRLVSLKYDHHGLAAVATVFRRYAAGAHRNYSHAGD